MTQTKPLRTWVYLDDEDQDRLEKLLKNLGKKTNQATVLSEIVAAGLIASANYGYRLPRPLVFTINDTALEQRSTIPKPTRK